MRFGATEIPRDYVRLETPFNANLIGLADSRRGDFTQQTDRKDDVTDAGFT